MNYNVKGTGIALSDEMRAYVEKKLAHADKFINGDTTALADIELQYAPLNDGGKYRAEFTVSVGGSVYRASEWGSTMHEAMDIAAGELVKELRQHKNKKLHMLRRGATRIKEYVRGWRDKM